MEQPASGAFCGCLLLHPDLPQILSAALLCAFNNLLWVLPPCSSISPALLQHCLTLPPTEDGTFPTVLTLCIHPVLSLGDLFCPGHLAALPYHISISKQLLGLCPTCCSRSVDSPCTIYGSPSKSILKPLSSSSAKLPWTSPVFSLSPHRQLP